MAIREYKCECGLVSELIIWSSAKIPDAIPCPRCTTAGHPPVLAQFQAIPSSFALARSSFSEAPLDVVIGHDADRRWKDIHTQQETRDRVRKETGSLGLSVNSKGDYTPISEESKAKRTELQEVLSTSGHKPEFDNPSDAKILDVRK